MTLVVAEPCNCSVTVPECPLECVTSRKKKEKEKSISVSGLIVITRLFNAQTCFVIRSYVVRACFSRESQLPIVKCFG